MASAVKEEYVEDMWTGVAEGLASALRACQGARPEVRAMLEQELAAARAAKLAAKPVSAQVRDQQTRLTKKRKLVERLRADLAGYQEQACEIKEAIETTEAELAKEEVELRSLKVQVNIRSVSCTLLEKVCPKFGLVPESDRQSPAMRQAASVL